VKVEIAQKIGPDLQYGVSGLFAPIFSKKRLFNGKSGPIKIKKIFWADEGIA